MMETKPLLMGVSYGLLIALAGEADQSYYSTQKDQQPTTLSPAPSAFLWSESVLTLVVFSLMRLLALVSPCETDFCFVSSSLSGRRQKMDKVPPTSSIHDSNQGLF